MRTIVGGAWEPDVYGHQLTELEERMLAFERQWWKYSGAKEIAVRERFDMWSTRYYQVLNALIDRPAAMAHDPLLVHRLRRLREQRAAFRSRLRTEYRIGGPGFGADWPWTVASESDT